MFSGSFPWMRPDYLGVKDGRLARCKRSPNCVCSQGDPADRGHHVEPIPFSGDFSRVRPVVEAMEGATVIRAEGNYLYAEFRSRLFRFVDDVELLFAGNQIHVRSASRLGRRDFGVNRNRIEILRKLLA